MNLNLSPDAQKPFNKIVVSEVGGFKVVEETKCT